MNESSLRYISRPRLEPEPCHILACVTIREQPLAFQEDHDSARGWLQRLPRTLQGVCKREESHGGFHGW